MFLDAPGGTGKIFLLNLLLAKIRMRRSIAIAVAFSGIAATLLDGGRTAHSSLKLTLNLTRTQREALCNGTRMIFDTTINNKLLRCTIVGTAKQVLKPRITFRPKDGQFPFQWCRRQFPITASFATTINKDRLSSSSEYGCANLSSATASSMWLRPGLAPRPNCCRTRLFVVWLISVQHCDNAPLRLLWTPYDVGVIPAFLLITAANNYVSHNTWHISYVCCSPTRPDAGLIVIIRIYMLLSQNDVCENLYNY